MRRPKIPRTLPIVALVLLILGIIATQAVPALTTEEQLSKNVLLAAIPFVLIFVSILLFYITLIVIVARAFNDLINPGTYNRIMSVVIGGIIVGILAMFQPWELRIYTLGFVLLLISTLTYILWSHVVPGNAETYPEELVSAAET